MHPLEVRGWVIGKLPEEIDAELVRRIEHLDQAIRPYRSQLLDAAHALVEQPLRAWGFTDQVPRLPAEAEDPVARTTAASTVAAYWEVHEFRSGYVLPSIQIFGVPWDTPPNVVHVLDLDPDLIRIAMTKAPEFKHLQRVATTPALAFARLFGAAQG